MSTLMERSMMNCLRCKGLMVNDIFEDVYDDTGVIYFRGWRCPSCGEIMDPIILRHRLSRALPPIRKTRTRPGPISLE